MQLRKSGEPREIEKSEIHLRTTALAGWEAVHYTKKGIAVSKRAVTPAIQAGIHSVKNGVRSKDIRTQLKYLTPEQRKQWNSYSYRKQTEILEKAERISVKSYAFSKSKAKAIKEGGYSAVNHGGWTKGRVMKQVLNAQAKGNSITNTRGVGDKWEVDVIKKKGKHGLPEYEKKTFYTDNVAQGTKQVNKLQRQASQEFAVKKTEGKIRYMKQLSATLDREGTKLRQIRSMQKEDQISQGEVEHAEITAFIHRMSAPATTKAKLMFQNATVQLLEKTGQSLMKILAPVLSIVLITTMLIVTILVMSSGGKNQSGSGGGNGADIVAVAQAEVKPENVGGAKFWSFMGFPARVPWCAAFVSWCGNELSYQAQNIMPSSASCGDYVTYYSNKDLIQPSAAKGGDYIPRRGDFAIFDWNSDGFYDHIGIVTSCDNSMVYTVEGNTSDAVNNRQYSIGSSSIAWYCTPQYPSGGLGGTGEGGYAVDAGWDSYTDSQKDIIMACVQQEDNGSYDGALAVISCIMNRTESAGWQGSGTTAWAQLTAPGQFCYSIDSHWSQWLGGNQYEYVKQAVTDCLELGIRNHEYVSFRSTQGSQTGSDGAYIPDARGNYYFSHK